MRRSIPRLAAAFSLAFLFGIIMPAQRLAAGPVRAEDRVVVAYVTSWSDVLPDPALVTHVNYAFGHVNDSFDGVRIDGGERFSFNDAVGPRTTEKGYVRAVNGRGAKVRGGGVSQLAATLLLAVEDFGWMDVEEYMAYGDNFTGDYVGDASKAVVTDYEHDHDLAFTNRYPGPVAISAWVADSALCVSISPSLVAFEGGFADYGDNAAWVGTLANGATPMPAENGQIQNVRLAASLIDGCRLRYGERFSFNGVVGPRTKDAGFVDAANGRGVQVTGGGVAQVASTVYLAVKQLDSITVDPVRTYGDRFTGGYVADSADAVVTDYNAGTDFSFTYYGARTLIPALASRFTHGEVVAVGLIVQHVYNGSPDEAAALAARLRGWGLAASMGELGFPCGAEDFESFAAYMLGTKTMKAAGADAEPRLREALKAIFQ